MKARLLEDCVIQEVMKELSDNGIAYEMSDPMVNDRAKCKYIDRYDGDYENVVGLPGKRVISEINKIRE